MGEISKYGEIAVMKTNLIDKFLEIEEFLGEFSKWCTLIDRFLEIEEFPQEVMKTNLIDRLSKSRSSFESDYIIKKVQYRSKPRFAPARSKKSSQSIIYIP